MVICRLFLDRCSLAFQYLWPGEAVGIIQGHWVQYLVIVAVDLCKEGKILRPDTQFGKRLAGHVTDPVRKNDFYPLHLLRSFLFKRLAGQDINCTFTPGRLNQHGLGDRKEIERVAELALREPDTQAGIEQRQFRKLLAVDNGKVDDPDAIRGRINGALVAKGPYVQRLPRLNFVNIRNLRAMQHQIFGLAEIRQILPFWIRQTIVNIIPHRR